MRTLLQTILLFAALVLFTGIDLPNRYGMKFPRQPGPIFDHQMRRNYINELNRELPELVLLGDSSLRDGVDEHALSALTLHKAYKITIPGAASALWYLIEKNTLTALDHKPAYLIVVFRDTMLTAPGYRVQGSYFTRLDEYAYHREPVVLERAYVNLMNPLEFAAEKYWPLYAARLELRHSMDDTIRYGTTARLGCDRACTDAGLYGAFGAGDLEPGQMRAALAAADSYLYTARQLDFESQVGKSFLPEMIRLARENEMQLILVRIKNLSLGYGNFQSPALKRYVADLSHYLAENGVQFLDFGADPRLKREYYADPIHLTEDGRRIFTGMLAEALESVLH